MEETAEDSKEEEASYIDGSTDDLSPRGDPDPRHARIGRHRVGRCRLRRRLESTFQRRLIGILQDENPTSHKEPECHTL